jgi:hypothetical protein
LWLEEKHGSAVAFLLVKRILHLLDCGLEEEGYQVLVGAIGPFGLKGADVLLAVLFKDDKFWQVMLQQDEIG